jgi:NADPH:quinone reductase-like Zn-dependent oxidoreductase
MTTTSKVLLAIAGVLAVAGTSFAVVLSRNAPCGTPPALPADAETMKAIVYRCYGSPEVLRLEDIARPTPADDEVLIRVRAISVNPVDWHLMTGTPYLLRMDGGMGTPASTRFGVDYAGTVEAAGKSVTRFKPGDEVFGARRGAAAEYITVREANAVPKPANLSFEQAAAVPVAALTALQGLRDRGKIKPGQKVLINGASGGVGTFAVQIAKSFGAEVTGVCSTRNAEMVRGLGADRVIDYTKEDFTDGDERYDLILDNVGNHSFSDLRGVMTPNGIYVMVGGPKTNNWLGPMGRAMRAPLYSKLVDQEFAFFISEMKPDDLALIGDLMQAGKVTPVIDRRYSLSEVAEAMRYLGTGHARAKIVIALE